MRLLSIGAVTAGSRRVARRFPEAVAVAALAPVFGHLAKGEAWAGAFAAAALGISAFFTLALTLERLPAGARLRRGAPRLVFGLAVALPLAAFALLWPGWSGDLQVRRLFHVALALHLLAAFAPFLGRREPNGFWQYNRILLVRFLTGALYSAVLFAGLAIALSAGKPLFGIRVPGQVFLDLWLVIAFVFNTLFFLGGIPDDLSALEADERYPTGLKVFAQYILVPLVAVYLAILTAYLVRVLVTGQWPKGWIGYLVSSVAVAGILSLLLVHPVRQRAENRWIATYARWFYLALLPSIGMLFAAIGQRIGQYGVTEDRYFLLVLAIWLAAIALGYGARRAADIRWIPITLCAVALATLAGPWSAYGVSRADQVKRLMVTLERQGLLQAGTPVRASGTVPLEVRQALTSSLRYLTGTHGVEALPAGLRGLAGADSTRGSRTAHFATERILRGLGVPVAERWQTSEERSFSFHAQRQSAGIPAEVISDFDYVVRLYGTPPFDCVLGAERVEVTCDRRAPALVVAMPWGPPRTLSLAAAMDTIGTAQSGARLRVSPSIRIEGAGASSGTRLVIHSASGAFDSDTLASLFLEADLFLRRAAAGGSAVLDRVDSTAIMRAVR